MPTAAPVTTIPPGLSFVDTLAGYVLKACGNDPLTLARATILLPNRRTCRSLRDAFLRQSNGKPLLLPRMRPLDAVDEDEVTLSLPKPLEIPPALDDFQRRLLLAKLVMALGSSRGGHSPTADQALQLAAELARFLDAVQIERLDFADLDQLAPEQHADHWRITLEFLSILTQVWPNILAGLGVIDRQDRINRLLDAQADLWRHTPPEDLVIVAGATGSRPAAADLMAVIAELPRGMIVLPGLDRHLDDAAWECLDQAHPQWAMRQVLRRLNIPRQQVQDLVPLPDPRAARTILLSEALRPAETCEAWSHLNPLPATTLDRVSLLLAPTPDEEAGAIALILRHALETKNQTAALVTPDRSLARRVTAELERWGLGIDDSAGLPLNSSDAGGFLRLIATMIAEDFAPHSLLACLKHRLAAGGLDPQDFRKRVDRLELAVLRGPRPVGGLAVLADLLPESEQDLVPWVLELADLCATFANLVAQDGAMLGQFLAAHLELAESLAATESCSGADRLWQGEDGFALATMLAQLSLAAQQVDSGFPAFSGRRYPAVFDQFLAGHVARQAWGAHPRLFLWGSLEARLQQADVMVLAGLNEGTWPQAPSVDPWMSRPMRKTFGLPSPEWAIGQSAHDFSQAFAAPHVILSRSLRVDGTPTVPSRWLMRLETVMRPLKLHFSPLLGFPPQQWLEWYRQIDKPESLDRQPPPAPRPPLAARPRRLSVSDIELWRRDPYGLYAKRILALKALDPVDANPDAADYGTLIHRCIEEFVKTCPRHWPANAEHELLAVGQRVFAPFQNRPGLWAFWWPRYQRIVRWLVQHEAQRQPMVLERNSEVNGNLEFAAAAGPFLLHARADRIDRLKDGSVVVIDYKTGAPPTQQDVGAGYSPQLPLEGLIAREGKFRSIPKADISGLLFWHLKGGEDGGKEQSAGSDIPALIREAMEGLVALIATFDDEQTPYVARPHPDHAPKYSDYQHLARQKEWMAAED